MATRITYDAETGEELERVQVGSSESYITHIGGKEVDWSTSPREDAIRRRGGMKRAPTRQLSLDLRPSGAHTRRAMTSAGSFLKPDHNCSLCRLSKTANTVCLLGRGPNQSDVMIVGEAPGAQEDATGKPFVGKSGAILRDALEQYGFDEKDVFITNAVSCRPPDNRTPSKGEIKACKTWLDHQMSVVRPKYVLLLGNTPLMSITGAAGISKSRGHPFEKDGVIYLPTWHPAYVLRDETQADTFERDIKLFREIVDKGMIPREDNLNHTIVRTRKDFERMLDALRNEVSFDIETNGLYPWQAYTVRTVAGKEIQEPFTPQITMIGFGTADGEFSLPINHPESPWSEDAIDDMLVEIEDRLRFCKIIAHNGKFDFLWMLVLYGVTWYEFFEFDTMLAHYILDENSLHGLKMLAQKFCGAPDWDIDKKQKQGHDVPLDKLGIYHGHDLYYTRELYFIFKKMLAKDLDVRRVYREILMPCARLFVEIEFDGVYIDVDKFDDAEAYLREEYNTALEKLAEWEPEPELDKKGRPIEFNWGSTQQLAKLLFGDEDEGGLGIEPLDKTAAGNASCSESVLKRIDHPCVGDLLKFRAAKQQLSFFIDGWKPFLHKKYVKGKWLYFLHPSFKLHGTVTGRLSCEHPNLQQVPRDPRIRSLITAPPGWTLLECDLSQIELRIAAELAGERNMIQAFIDEIDVHWLTAIREIERGGGLKDLVIDTAQTWKQDGVKLQYPQAIEILLEMGPDAAVEINKEWKEYRKKAKAINFGYLYGMWWKKFKLYARDNYGVDVTDKQAEDSRIAFFDLYSDYPKWHTRQRRYARQNGYVRSLSGRKRRLPKATSYEDTPERQMAERQAINSPVQSFANELNLMALIQLREEYGRDVVQVCGTVHDAILLRVRDDRVPEVTRRLLEIMSWPALMDVFEIEVTVPIKAEAGLGPWGKSVSLEKWMTERKIKDVKYKQPA